MTVTYRVGVDIGGTFTDIVLLGLRRHHPHQEDLLERGQLRPGHRRRPERDLPRDRTRGRHHRGDPPRHDRRLQRHPRAQGRAGRADHHQGLPRRAGNPHLAHAQALRPHLDQAGAAGRALPAQGGRRAHRPSRPCRAPAPAGRRRARRRCAARREGRGDRHLPAQFLHQSGARGDAAATSSPARPLTCRSASPSRSCPRSRNTSAPRPRSSTPMSCRSSPPIYGAAPGARRAPAFRPACC